jgi:hypothetical protein
MRDQVTLTSNEKLTRAASVKHSDVKLNNDAQRRYNFTLTLKNGKVFFSVLVLVFIYSGDIITLFWA